MIRFAGKFAVLKMVKFTRIKNCSTQMVRFARNKFYSTQIVRFERKKLQYLMLRFARKNCSAQRVMFTTTKNVVQR